MTLVRRAFGFSPETEDEEGEYDPTVPTYAVSNPTEPEAAPASSAVTDPAPAPMLPAHTDSGEAETTVAEGPENDKKLSDDLFDAVIDLFNRTQPEFVRECLNTDAQRLYILNSLSDSLRQRVKTALSTDTTQWEKEKEELKKKIAELQGDDNELERLRKENRKLQLSVDRQKRALLDRINDLETQLTKQAQEKERYYSRKPSANTGELDKAKERIRQLETEAEEIRSKNAGLDARIAEMDTLLKEAEARQAELIKAAEEAAAKPKNDEAAPSSDEDTIETEKLRAELEQAQTALREKQTALDEANAAIEQAKAAINSEKESLAEARAALEQEKATVEEARTQLTEANSQLAAQCESLREEVARQTTLKEQLEVKTSMSDAMINDLRNQAASSRAELERLQHEQESVLSQIQQQLDGFEDLKARKDAKISELQESNSSLRRTIETNLYNQANSEMKLRSEIKSLKAEIARMTEAAAGPQAASATVGRPMTPEAAMAVEKPAPRRRGRPKKNRIDTELDNTDWFAGGSAKHDDPDFGYHEPPRKPVNDNDAQLSLF